MNKRYSTLEMEAVWKEEEKFKKWAKVEIAVLEAKRELGMIEENIPEDLLNQFNINPEEIDRIEREDTKHDVIAFLMHTSPQLPENLRPHWHNKMTSYDTQDTAFSLQLRNSIAVLLRRTEILMKAIKEKAFEYKYTAQIGRTHGVHAEPITFGVKLANWYDELKRHIERLKRLYELVSVGKISGAVGVYTLDPKVEKIALKKLGLRPILATQIISRDIIADYMATLAIIGGNVEKICVNIRTLQRTEIREAQEHFSKKQRGSSAMPHKRNPIGSENLSGMARVLRGYLIPALENQNTWDERDLANSGSERIILPDASVLLDYMLKRLTGIIEKLIVYPEQMHQNILLTKGLVFSQNVQSLFAQKSKLPREEAYRIVQKIAQDCWSSNRNFFAELTDSEEIMKHLTLQELENCFKLDDQLKYVDHIFEQVFGKEKL